MAEDMSSRVGAFGDAVAVTPNIDQLAEEGVRYTNFYTTAGVCSPSRAAMILGMHQISTGTQHMRTASRPEGGYFAVPPPEVKAYPEILRSAGYYTFTDQKLDYQFSKAFSGTGPFSIWDTEDVKSRGWENRNENQPFFGQRNFLVSHESGLFSPLGNWPNSRVHLMMQLYRWWQGNEDIPLVVSPDDVNVPPYYPDTRIVREDIARHYNNIAAMDQQVGEILGQLEADGLADSTIIIWTTDHGDGLPRAKRELHDSGIKVPMIVRWPARYRPTGQIPGSIDHRLISAVDLAPTVLEMADIKAPEHIHGESFTDSNRKYIYASRDRIDAILDRQRAVRDNRFKYIRSWHPDQPEGHDLAYRDNINMVREMKAMYESGQLNANQQLWYQPPGPERLYDLETDPHELYNLVDDLEYREDLNRMRAALDQWLLEVEDWSEQPEEEMVARFTHDGEQKKTLSPRVEFVDCQLNITAVDQGSSLSYRFDNEKWRLFTKPIAACDAKKVEIRAVRYGWQPSEVTSFVIPN